MRCIGFLYAVVGAAALVSPVAAETYVVDPNGTGDYPTIQAAIAAAETGDIIELTDGTFTGAGNREIDFGGKAITVRSQTGNPEACIINCQRGEGQPYRGFDFHGGEGLGSVVEAVTVTAGWTAAGGRGAAVRCRDSSNPMLRNCRFINCAAEHGGGISCEGSSPTIVDCVFSDNRGSSDGGGLCCVGASPTLTGCSFLSNEGNVGAGIHCEGASAPALSACFFSDNSAGVRGGGLSCEDTSSPVLTSCTVVANSAPTGAGILARGEAKPILADCTLAGNIGGSEGSVIHAMESSSVTLGNTIIAYSTQGVSVACENAGSAELTCCNVYGNDGGDWVGCIEAQEGEDGNIAVEPLFCNMSDGDYSLCANSPCAAENNGECGQIGAWPVGCEACTTPVVRTTWGRLKTGYK